MSDHGFRGLSKIVQINKWLQDHQLQYLRQKRLSRHSLLLFVTPLLHKIDGMVSRYDYFGLRRVLKQGSREMRKNYSMNHFIDWSRTRAYMGRPSESGIFVNLKGREKLGIVEPGAEYEALRNDIISSLKQLTDPETEKPVFENVYRREDVYQGPYVKYAPDVILHTGGLPYQESDNLLAPQVFQTVGKVGKNNLSGKHHPDGILMIAGKEIHKGLRLDDIHIRDVAPTILYLLDRKIPVDMDGRVIEALFDKELFKNRPIRMDHDSVSTAGGEELRFDDQESAELEKRLKDLGYL
jgi:predicted AlkP superfamily phosphohydrolase/phosphomutase